MKTGIIRFSDTCNLSLMIDNDLLFSDRLGYSSSTLSEIVAKLSPFGVDRLRFIIKTSVVNEAPKTCAVISSFKIGKISKYSVVSETDLNSIQDIGQALGLDACEIVDYFSYYKSLQPSGSFIVVDTYLQDLYCCVYIKDGIVYDYRNCRQQQLGDILSVLMQRYNCEKVITTNNYEELHLEAKINNFSLITNNSTKLYLAPSLAALDEKEPYVLDIAKVYDENSNVNQREDYYDESTLPATDYRESSGIKDKIFGIFSRKKEQPLPNIEDTGYIPDDGYYDSASSEYDDQSDEAYTQVGASVQPQGVKSISGLDDMLISIILVALVVVTIGCAICWPLLPKLANGMKIEKQANNSTNAYLKDITNSLSRRKQSTEHKEFTYASMWDSLNSAISGGGIYSVVYDKSTVDISVYAENEDQIKSFTTKIGKPLTFVEYKSSGSVKIDSKEYKKYIVICKY